MNDNKCPDCGSTEWGIYKTETVSSEAIPQLTVNIVKYLICKQCSKIVIETDQHWKY